MRLKNDKLTQIPFYGAMALLIYMPFHIFLSQWLSTITGGLEAWKGAKDGFTFVLLLVSLALVIGHTKYRDQKLYWTMFALSIAYFSLHITTYFLNKDTSTNIAALATAYNCRLMAYALIGWSAVILTPELINPRKLIKLILIISTIVCLIGLIQYALPKDLMTHFGYSIERGVKPNFFIDDKPDLPRIMSTLRDPNSLAAYLVIPITLIWAVILQIKRRDRYTLLFGLLGLHLLTLLLTFSRSGLAGVMISLFVIAILIKKDLVIKVFNKYWMLIIIGILVVISGAFVLRDQYFVQNVIFHSDETTVAELDSNDLHASLAQIGLEGIIDQPIGHGPGTAGIVSIQNPNGGVLTENYYIQIGYEVGIAGLLLFLMIISTIYRQLLSNKIFISKTLVASFWAFLIINMLLHSWTNEAVAAQWWLLAGMAIAHKLPTSKVSGKSKIT